MFWGKIERYIIKAVVPYLALSLSLLTLILIIQQATRFAEVISYSRFDLYVMCELVILISPGILLFTVPMASLVGASLGFSRLLNDSELTAIRCGGVSLWRIMGPVILLGASLSVALLLVGFVLLPSFSGELRRISGEIALRKLASPVEPGSFFTGFPGRVIYVKDGDEVSGSWGRIFIHWKDNEDTTRLITARSGRVNYGEEGEELYLEEAVITTIGAGGNHISERASELRLKDERLRQYKSSFLEKLRNGEKSTDELNLAELSRRVRAGGAETVRRDAEISLHRRLALSFSPLVLCFIGSILVIKTKKGGKVNGLILSAVIMVGYYLLFLLGEQSARGGAISPRLGLWLAPATFALSGCLLIFAKPGVIPAWRQVKLKEFRPPSDRSRSGQRESLAPFLGAFDQYVFKSLVGMFVASSALLLIIFLIFTTFELVKFITVNNISSQVVFKYLLLLVPYASLNILPISTLISVLLCFTLMVRRSEGVIWLATGLSAFRIILPAAIFSVAVGLGLWLVQETILPQANIAQNDLRSYIRSGNAAHRGQRGDHWFGVPGENRIYSLGEGGGLLDGRYRDPSVYMFDDQGVHLRQILKGRALEVTPGGQAQLLDARVYGLSDGSLRVTEYALYPLGERIKSMLNAGELAQDELSTRQLSETLQVLKRDSVQVDEISLAIEVRRSTPFIPPILALVAAPFAFLYTRQKFLAGVVYSIALSIIFLVAAKSFQTLGSNGFLPPIVAAWAPPAIFTAMGIYLLGKMRT